MLPCRSHKPDTTSPQVISDTICNVSNFCDRVHHDRVFGPLHPPEKKRSKGMTSAQAKQDLKILKQKIWQVYETGKLEEIQECLCLNEWQMSQMVSEEHPTLSFTLLELAHFVKHEPTIELLLEYGANPSTLTLQYLNLIRNQSSNGTFYRT
jgi:hypothetical protein